MKMRSVMLLVSCISLSAPYVAYAGLFEDIGRVLGVIAKPQPPAQKAPEPQAPIPVTQPEPPQIVIPEPVEGTKCEEGSDSNADSCIEVN